jgi:ribonuclease HIII
MQMPSLRIPADQVEKIRRLLQGCLRPRTVPNSLWSFEGNGVYLTMYRTGTLLLQGREADLWAEKVLNMVEVPEGPVAGCDEVGKGEVFGPVVVCCAVIDPENYRKVLRVCPRDSKTLGDEEVFRKASALRDLVRFKIVRITPEKFNRIYPRIGNMNRILDEAYRRLLDWVRGEKPLRITVDAYSKVNPFRDLENLRFLEKGEREVEVSVASILARERFLREIRKLGSMLGESIPRGSSREALLKAREILKRDPQKAQKLIKLFMVI